MTESLKPILAHGAVINGMMPIHIQNMELFCDENTILKYEFILSYKFIFKHRDDKYSKNNGNYANNKWKQTNFTINNIDCNNKFVIKVPLFLLSYSLQFNLSLKVFKLSTGYGDNNDDSEDDMMDIIISDNEWELMTNSQSINYISDIPSILIESEYNIGDHVQYVKDGLGFARSGIILNIDKSTNIHKIKTDASYCNDIVQVHKTKLLRFPTQSIFVVDITDRIKAECDLILVTKKPDPSELETDEEKDEHYNVKIYQSLCEYLFEFYWSEMYEIYDYIDKDSLDNVGYMKVLGNMVATNIYKFLFDINYNSHRIQCVYGNGSANSYLYYDQQWKYHILRQFLEHKNATSIMQPLQEARNRLGYTCDICRIELNWYEFVYHCNCDHSIFTHDYCITCIHAIMNMYIEMKKYISSCIQNLNDDCIEEIVTFCVGKVVKFV